MDKKTLIDIAERTLATAAEAGIAYALTRVGSVNPAYAVPLATGLAALKSWIASHWGGNASAVSAAPPPPPPPVGS